jgi:S-adenosyl methyltransferase
MAIYGEYRQTWKFTRKGALVNSGGPSSPPESSGGDEHPSFDTSVAHVARIYDYWLGGKDNYAVDRAAGDAGLAVYPDIVHSVRANRAFLARAVRYLATEAGIRQFLDIGEDDPYGIVAKLTGAVPAGSYLALAHVASDID